MAMMNKVLGAAKTAAKPFFSPNDPTERGLTGLLVPYKFSGLGLGVAIGAPIVGAVGASMLSASNRAAIGRVTYQPTMARMVGGDNTGAVEAMKRASGGNYKVFSEMAEGVVSRDGITGIIEDYGANPAMISALYNMGR